MALLLLRWRPGKVKPVAVPGFPAGNPRAERTLNKPAGAHVVNIMRPQPNRIGFAARWRGRVAVGLVWIALGVGAAEPDVRRDAVVAAVEKVLPAVVNLATETIVPISDPFEQLLREFWDPYHRRQTTRYSLGSAVIIDEEGYVLTNDHVVRRASRIWINLTTGTNVYEAKLVGRDPKTDIALLKIQAPAGQKFTAIEFAEDDDLLLGETVLALGNPFGLGGSVSRGILSSKNRMVPQASDQLDVPNWLQTDASINPGNSGGPLVNLRGQLIGLNVAILREAQGIGFAIPVKRINEALAEILSPETMNQLWFGAQVRAGVPVLRVLTVDPDSPAARAGLRQGDRILQVNGRVPRGLVEFNRLLTANPARASILLVERDGSRRTLSVRLRPETEVFNAELIQRKLGVSLQELTPALAAALGLNTTDGFVVAGVDRDNLGLQPGMLVTAIDGQRPADLTAAAKLIHKRQKGEKVRLAVMLQQRFGRSMILRQGVAEVEVRE